MKPFLFFLLCLPVLPVVAADKIPEALKPWQDWATWGEARRGCPSPFNAADKFFSYCPSELSLQAGSKDGRFSLAVTVFHETSFPLPGDADLWPLNVLANGQPVAVVERAGLPSVTLPAGSYRLTGDYRWNETPQKVRVPADYGMLSLSVDGKAALFPNWDAEGFLWLKRNQIEEGDKDFLGIQVYRMIEDGIPMWLHTILELSVAGKSREVELGDIMPEGWSLSSIGSPIPVAVDDQGNVKAQVRAGKWLVELKAFRTTHSAEFKMKPGVHPVAEHELVCFKADPEFRMLDLRNATPVDVTQTTFPQAWRQWPVYQWNVATPISLDEKMRGSGLQSPKSLTGSRELWLNEAGHGYTYRDQLSGTVRDLWRLDVPAALQLGSVKVNNEAQLITLNPATGATGVEIRTRNLQLEAAGTSRDMQAIPSTGWNTDLDSLSITLNLPPGWRLLALFGAESVDGDWLTSWTLLDLFLLLIFSLAVSKLWGWPAGVIAFLAFGLTYHEPNSPRFIWLFLLMPLALLRVIPEGKARTIVTFWKYAALVLLLFILIPFTYQQIQSVIYPQLEVVRESAQRFLPMPGALGQDEGFVMSEATVNRNAMPPTAAAAPAAPEPEGGEYDKLGSLSSSSWGARKGKSRAYAVGNMRQLANARIQTGPGVPDWHWRYAVCRWTGPVSSAQTITPVLLPPWGRKLVVLTELALVLWLITRLLEIKRIPMPPGRRAGGAALMACLCMCVGSGQVAAQEIPDKETLATLKERLLKQPDCYPHCAEIPSVSLQLGEDRISYETKIDAAITTLVPLPGRLPSWAPVKVQLDGNATTALRRGDGYLWVVVPAGVHHVKVEGLLPGTRELEWSFLLKPRTITISAPAWNVTGLKRDGTPEQQVFFARKQTGGKQDSAYDRREFHTLAVVDRVLEIGLVWQVHNTVTRLSAPGKAIALQIPLLEGEQVLSAGVTPAEGKVDVRLAANQNSFSWDSEIPMTKEIQLAATTTDRWVERWHLVSSPVWDVTLAGLKPLIETEDERLVPVWHPWPGESATLRITRPEAVNGPTMTIHQVAHQVDLGNGNRNSTLRLTLQCSMGDDLVVGMGPSTEITSVMRGETTIPVRREGGKLIVPVQPGMQNIEIAWKEARPLGLWAASDRLELPVESSNITTTLRPPSNRWVLWTHGPLRGPAVRFWSVLAVGLLASWVLGGLPLSPLNRKQWALLMVGLTQINLLGSLIVVGWLFLLAHRGTPVATEAKRGAFNSRQVLIVMATAISLWLFIVVVYQGLLGNPEMFITGNGSHPSSLNWYAAQSAALIPQPGMISVSVWFYRILMLFWALWLSASLLRWLAWGWRQFIRGGAWRGPPQPPPIPAGS